MQPLAVSVRKPFNPLIIPSKHSSWWRRLEDVFLQKASSRRLQNVLIKTNIFAILIRLQDVLIKTNIFVLVIRLQEVFKTFSRRLQDIFKTPSRRFDDVFKTSSRHLQGVLQRFLQDAFKTYHQVILFLLKSFRDVFKTYSQRFWGVLQR